MSKNIYNNKNGCYNICKIKKATHVQPRPVPSPPFYPEWIPGPLTAQCYKHCIDKGVPICGALDNATLYENSQFFSSNRYASCAMGCNWNLSTEYKHDIKKTLSKDYSCELLCTNINNESQQCKDVRTPFGPRLLNMCEKTCEDGDPHESSCIIGCQFKPS